MVDVVDNLQPQKKMRLSSFRQLDLKRKAAAGAGAAGLFLLGFIAENGLTAAMATVFPNQSEVRALQIQENLQEKAASIETLSNSIQARLSELGSNSGLAEETQQLLAAIDDLRPDIYAAAEINRSSSARLASAKANELQGAGFSAVSDFDLRDDEGVTVCAPGQSFGISSNNGGNIIARLSANGRTNPVSLSPGASVSIETSNGKSISVNYLGWTDETNGIYGFDVDCG